jgi:hypothetical protein
MHRPGDPKKTEVRELPKVILCPVALTFEHSTLVRRAKQRNHSAIAALIARRYLRFYLINNETSFFGA